MAIDPSTFAPQGDASVPLDTFTATFDEGIRNADAQLKSAQDRYRAAQGAVAAIDPNKITSQDALKAAQDEMAKAATVAENAAAQVTRAHELKAAAIERYSQRANVTPELRARYSAMADVERANAQQKLAENFEFLNAIPEKRAQLHATTVETQANAAVAQAKADVAGATTDIEKQAAQTRLDQANASLKSTQLANTHAGLQNKITAAQAEVAPRVAEAGATSAEQDAALKTYQTAVAKATTQDEIDTAHQKYLQSVAATKTAQAGATTAEAAAQLAPQQAQATYDKARADADNARLGVQQLQAQLDATTDEDRKRAVQLELNQKQATLDAANQQLDAAKQLLPISVAQGQANVAATTAGTQKGLLGSVYGLPERIKAIGDALRSGQITDPAKAQQQLQDYITTTIQGTTPFERDKFLTEQETSRRGQDYSLAGTQTSTFGSGFSSALGTFGKLNDTIEPGSDAGGRGFLASMDMLGDRIKSFQPTPSSPLLDSMRPQPAAAAPALPPLPGMPDTSSAGAGGGHQITINIGGTGAAASTPPAMLAPGMAGTNADPMVAGSPAFQATPQAQPDFGAASINDPSRGTPAMLGAGNPAFPDHVDAAWQDDPNLHPELAAAGGGGGARVM